MTNQQEEMTMKKTILAIAAALAFFASPVAFANESGNDADNNNMGNSNGASAQMRNIDRCIYGNTGTVKSYDLQSHVKPCTLSGKYADKPVPKQEFKTPFR